MCMLAIVCVLCIFFWFYVHVGLVCVLDVTRQGFEFIVF